MNKSSWVLTLTAGAVVAALAIGGFAYVTSERVEAQSSSSTISWMPAGATVVGHLDFTALMNSPIRDRWEEAVGGEGEDERLEEFRATTGIDPMTDIHRLSFSAVATEDEDGDGSSRRAPTAERWGVAIQGSFDSARLIAKAREESELTVESYQGTQIYVRSEDDDSHDDGDEDDGEHANGDDDHRRHGTTVDAFAFVDDTTVLIGDSAYIREMLDVGAGRSASAAPALDERWGAGSFMEDTFWVAAAPKSGFGGMLPEGANLPPITSLSLAGRLDGELALRARGQAADSVAATKLADVVRGFVALGSLQGGENPDLGEILDSVLIDQIDNEVDVSIRVGYETLERLRKQAENTEALQF